MLTLGLCTPVYDYPVSVQAVVSSKQKTSRETSFVFGTQRNLTGEDFLRRCSRSGKSLLRNSGLSAARMEALSGMDRGLVLVIMGVSGAGKTTVGDLLSKNLDCPFIDADDFHTLESKQRMRDGIPLTDDDRWPWLEKLRDVMAEYINNGKTAILACSALSKGYRSILRSADAGNTARNIYVCSVMFFHLKGSYELFESRIAARHKEGKHFMPANLLQSQLDLLEEGDETEIESSFMNVDASLSPQAIVNRIRQELHARHKV